MMIRPPSSRLLVPAPGRSLSTGIVVRVTLAALVLCLALGPALAAGPALKGDVAVKGDTLTLRDLVEGAAGPASDKPLFRAPALGQTGTIQSRRIVEAALAAGLGPVETGGRPQVVVTRSARRVAAPEMEAAIRRALEGQSLADPGAVSVVLDGAPVLVLPADMAGAVTAQDLSYDRRSRRLSAVIAAGTQPGERRSSLRVSGSLIETIEVPVLKRALGRGETVQAGDVVQERRPKDSLASDVDTSQATLVGRVARRLLGAGSVLRSGDLGRPEVIARGEAILLVYEMPGLSLSVRGKATEGGAIGDAIAVVNPQSKRSVQATVLGPGRAAAQTVPGARPAPGSLADASAAAR